MKFIAVPLAKASHEARPRDSVQDKGRVAGGMRSFGHFVVV